MISDLAGQLSRKSERSRVFRRDSTNLKVQLNLKKPALPRLVVLERSQKISKNGQKIKISIFSRAIIFESKKCGCSRVFKGACYIQFFGLNPDLRYESVFIR